MIKFKRLNWKFVKDNYPVLYETIHNWEGFHEMTERQKEYIAGLCLEIALTSDGTPDIFLDKLELDKDEWDEDYIDI